MQSCLFNFKAMDILDFKGFKGFKGFKFQPGTLGIYRLLMDTDGLSAVEELEAMQKHEICVRSRKETVEHFRLYITLHLFTLCNSGQEVWRLGNETMRQVLTLSCELHTSTAIHHCFVPLEFPVQLWRSQTKQYFTHWSHGESIRASPKAS